MATLFVLPKAELIDTEEKARELLALLVNQPMVAIDTETTNQNAHKARLLCWSVGWDTYRATIYDLALTKAHFKSWFANPKYKKSFHNAKYDLIVLKNHRIDVAGTLYDTYIIDWLVDENRQGMHGLKICAKDHLGLTMNTFSSLMKEHDADIFTDLPMEIQLEYSTKDTWATYGLATKASKLHGKSLVEVLKDLPAAIPGRHDRTLHDHLIEIEMPFMETLMEMEMNGISIDKGYLKDLDESMPNTMTTLSFEVNAILGEVVNLNSAPALAKLIFPPGHKRIVKRWTKGGAKGERKPSVDHTVLEELAEEEQRLNPGVEGKYAKILKYKKLQKIHSTYVKGILKELDEGNDGRLHSSFNGANVITGRLSSSEPNLQNVPKSKTDKFGIRKAFQADPGNEDGSGKMKLICADYEQLEMRIMAHFSEDKKLIDTIVSGIDVHTQTAAEMFGYDYKGIMAAKKKSDATLTPEELEMVKSRDAAKTIGFGLIYGLQAWNLAQKLGCTPQEAEASIAKYFKTYPGVLRFIEGIKKVCRRKGFVQTIFGRYRRIPEIRAGMTINGKTGDWEITSGDKELAKIRGHADNQSVNSPIQGTAADIAKMAMMKTSRGIYGDSTLKNLGIKLVLQVHDEVIWECPEAHVVEARERIKKIIEHPFDFELRVPLPVDIGIGEIWTEAKK